MAYVFGEGVWEKKAKSEAGGTWGIMQSMEGHVAGTQIPIGLPGAED